MKIKHLVQCGIITALLCVISPISIPVGPIPITLTTLIIYIVSYATSPSTSSVSVCLYIILGCLGLPVFAAFGAGPGYVIGPTCGFILGYIPLSLSISLFGRNKVMYIISMFIGTVLLYILGSIGLYLTTGNGLESIITTAVLPFLPGDIIKIIIAAIISDKIKTKVLN